MEDINLEYNNIEEQINKDIHPVSNIESEYTRMCETYNIRLLYIYIGCLLMIILIMLIILF